MENKRRALGKGLEELFNAENLDFDKMESEIIESATKDEIVHLKLSELRSNPYQPRKVFDEESLKELADSIRENGVFQPIIVRKSIKGYDIIAGERRVRASRMVGLETIPAIIRDFSDEQMMQIALLENLQRKDLNAIEEAEAYKSIIEALNITQEELAKKISKSRSHITNMLGLLRLPVSVQDLVLHDKISMGHARVLSKLTDINRIEELAYKIIKEDLNVRELEKLVYYSSTQENYTSSQRKNKNNEYEYIENIIKEKLGTKVSITNKKIIINFKSNEDLNRLLELLNIKINE